MLSTTYTTEPAPLYNESFEAALAGEMGLIQDVRQVFLERAEDDLLVWIALDNPTKDVLERVFQKQFDLIDGFPEVSVDFNVVPSHGKQPEEFASGTRLIYSREG